MVSKTENFRSSLNIVSPKRSCCFIMFLQIIYSYISIQEATTWSPLSSDSTYVTISSTKLPVGWRLGLAEGKGGGGVKAQFGMNCPLSWIFRNN